MDGVTPASSPAQTPPSPERLARLALACNQCRKRKVRCDAALPKCHNCTVRAEPCITSDPRKPGKGPGVRRRAVKGPRRSDASQSQPMLLGETLCQQSTGASRRLGGYGHLDAAIHAEKAPRGREGAFSDVGSAAEASTPSQSSGRPPSIVLGETGAHVSWISRGYHESRLAHRPLEEQPAIDAETPEHVVNRDDTSHRVKVGKISVELQAAAYGIPKPNYSNIVCFL
jgi:hypothetical protein